MNRILHSLVSYAPQDAFLLVKRRFLRDRSLSFGNSHLHLGVTIALISSTVLSKKMAMVKSEIAYGNSGQLSLSYNSVLNPMRNLKFTGHMEVLV